MTEEPYYRGTYVYLQTGSTYRLIPQARQSTHKSQHIIDIEHVHDLPHELTGYSVQYMKP